MTMRCCHAWTAAKAFAWLVSCVCGLDVLLMLGVLPELQDLECRCQSLWSVLLTDYTGLSILWLDHRLPLIYK